MARNYRDPFEIGHYYHIYNKVVSEVSLFNKNREYLDFLERYNDYFGAYFDTYAYCLIPNHFHFLVSVKDNIDDKIAKEDTNASRKYLDGEKHLNFFIENQLSRMFSGISIRYNSVYKRSGPLFKQGCKRVVLKTESRIMNQLCYIHHNPIHHNLRNSYESWKYSSYHDYLSNEATMVSKTVMIEFMGGMDVFHAWHNEFKLNQEENLFNEEID